MNQPRKLGPKPDGHPSIGIECPACNKPFIAGDYTTLVQLGPGDDPDAQERCRASMVYKAVAVEVHWTCATGRHVLPHEATPEKVRLKITYIRHELYEFTRFLDWQKPEDVLRYFFRLDPSARKGMLINENANEEKAVLVKDHAGHWVMWLEHEE